MYLDNLNESQKKAVTFNGKHLLVLAGAGTGKTRTIISRAAYLISTGVNPSKIQILTFTKRAASEIVSRVKSSLNTNQAQTLRGSTFHSWCNQLLTQYPNLFGTKSFTVIDEDDQISIMKMICGKNIIQYEGIKMKPQSLIDLYSFGRNTKRNLTETIRFKLFQDACDNETEEKIQVLKAQIEMLLRSYEQKKKDRKYLDYDDILQVVAVRLRSDEQARVIISSQFDHLLVDEMQDTNPLQWDLLNPFQKICNLFCVGDDAQSIYSFRGADFKNVHSFAERVDQSEVYKLEDNYRSTQEILDLSNWLLEKSPINYNKKLRAIRGKGKTPLILNVENDWEEARWIADKIINNYTKRDKTYSDHLILSRSGYYTTKLQAIFIEQKIPYQIFGGRKFMESAHLKDVISALRIVNNKDDEIAWMRFLTFWEGIGEIIAAKFISEVFNLENIEHCIKWLKTLSINQIDTSSISEVLECVSVNRSNVQKATNGAYKLMENGLAKKYKEDWEIKRRPDFPVLEVLANNYSTLGEFITECILDASPNINNSPTLNESIFKRSEISKDVVTISTIHSAKGLEADICFVLNVSPKAFPSSKCLGNIDEIEEDRRVLYVAITRTKNELIITRNINSIYAENKVLENTSDTNKSEKTIEEQYFLNGLPNELAEQEVIEVFNRQTKDLKEPNSLDVSYGMDFF